MITPSKKKANSAVSAVDILFVLPQSKNLHFLLLVCVNMFNYSMSMLIAVLYGL